MFTVVALIVRTLVAAFRPQFRYLWHILFAPIGKVEQKERLEKFYKGQADIYDATRSGLLRGRKTMLNLSAAHLNLMRASASSKGEKKRLVWVDIGGGTGEATLTMIKCLFDKLEQVSTSRPWTSTFRSPSLTPSILSISANHCCKSHANDLRNVAGQTCTFSAKTRARSLFRSGRRESTQRGPLAL